MHPQCLNTLVLAHKVLIHLCARLRAPDTYVLCDESLSSLRAALPHPILQPIVKAPVLHSHIPEMSVEVLWTRCVSWANLPL